MTEYKGIREYGGFLGMELPQKEEWFSKYPEEHLLRLNCGRTAFYCAVRDSGVRKVYVPYFNCENSVDPIRAAGAEIEYYYLDEDFTPMEVFPRENEAVLWINYYGNANEETKSKVCQKYPHLIIDNCQGFFSKPVMNAYNCYSARKFFGVSDGAYLIKKDIGTIPLSESSSADASLFLLRTIEEGTNEVYQENLANEKRLGGNYCKMSKLTRRILSSIDYGVIYEIRNRNFKYMHQRLSSVNQFPVDISTGTHMYYPLLVEQDSLRERLVKRRVYTPTWWRHVPEQCGYAPMETRLSQYVVLLPIDQRYTLHDMEEVCEIVYDSLDKKALRTSPDLAS